MGQPNPPADPGATPPAIPPADPATPPATGDDGLGEAGKKALAAEREARKALEQEVKALKDRDPLKEFLAKLGAAPAEPGADPAKALQDRMAALEERAKRAELAELKTTIATAKGLTAAQARRLQGSTREELEADADELLAAFPKPDPGKPGTPRPDPTQGARGSGAPGQLSAEDVKRLYAEGKYAEIEKARVDGRIDFGSARQR